MNFTKFVSLAYHDSLILASAYMEIGKKHYTKMSVHVFGFDTSSFGYQNFWHLGTSLLFLCMVLLSAMWQYTSTCAERDILASRCEDSQENEHER